MQPKPRLSVVAAVYCVLVFFSLLFSQGAWATEEGAALNIELEFIDEAGVPPRIRDLFVAAKAKWESVIVKGYAKRGVLKAGQYGCGKWFPKSLAKKRRTFEDLLVYVQILQYDGVGGVLGDATICRSSREEGKMMTRTGLMRFDVEDLDHWGERTAFQIVLHEMGHILGLGARWAGLRLIKKPYGKNIPYLGKHGKLGYAAVAGSSSSGRPLVENTGASGSARAHWLEDPARGGFDNELMTAWLDVGRANPLSALTVHALKDLGWTVDPATAEAYAMPSKRQSQLKEDEREPSSEDAPEKLFLGDDLTRRRPMRCATEGKTARRER